MAKIIPFTIQSITPAAESPLRIRARQLVAEYKRRKVEGERRQEQAIHLTQSDIDALPTDWPNGSETTRAKMHRAISVRLDPVTGKEME